MATLVHDDVLDGAPVRRGPPDGRRPLGPRPRRRRRRPALLPRLRGAGRWAAASAEVAELSSASVALALGELAQRSDAYDTSISEERYLRALPPEDGAAVRVRLPARAARLGRAGDRGPGRASAARSASPSSCSTTSSTSPGPPERTGKARGTDLLDGTVTLPLILAAGSIPGSSRSTCRGLDPAGAEEICDRIAATGALDQVREPGQAGSSAPRGCSPRRTSPTRSASCSAWSPTASSSATPEEERPGGRSSYREVTRSEWYCRQAGCAVADPGCSA